VICCHHVCALTDLLSDRGWACVVERGWATRQSLCVDEAGCWRETGVCVDAEAEGIVIGRRHHGAALAGSWISRRCRRFHHGGVCAADEADSVMVGTVSDDGASGQDFCSASSS